MVNRATNSTCIKVPSRNLTTGQGGDFSWFLGFLRLRITPRRIHPVAAIGAGEAAGLAGADDHQGAHAHLLGGEFAEGEGAQGFAGAADSYVGPGLRALQCLLGVALGK